MYDSYFQDNRKQPNPMDPEFNTSSHEAPFFSRGLLYKIPRFHWCLILLVAVATLMIMTQSSADPTRPANTNPADSIVTTGAKSEHKEAGQVKWIRSYDRGLSLVKQAEKPMLLLFQEIPG